MAALDVIPKTASHCPTCSHSYRCHSCDLLTRFPESITEPNRERGSVVLLRAIPPSYVECPGSHAVASKPRG